jgi:hypothetical protein
MEYYEMMLRNAKEYLKNANTLSEDCITAFEFSEILAICTGKLKEEVVIDLTK